MVANTASPSEQRTRVRRSREERINITKAILPLLTAEADEGERLTRLTGPAVNAMREAGLLHLLLPRELSGEQLCFTEALEIVEMLSWADGSAGWYSMVANAAAASVGAFLPEKGARIVYGNDPRVLVAGQGGPRGTAKQVDGGYLINGPWGYGSTIYHADFYHSGCLIVGQDGKPVLDANGNPRSIVCHFPKHQGVLQGNWDTLGLRGTGSYDYNVVSPDLFVPQYMTYAFTGDPPQRGGNQYSIGIVGFTTWCHASWAIGTTRRALDEIRKLAVQKSGPHGTLAGNPAFRQEYALAEGRFRAARALVYEVWRDIDATLQTDRPASVDQLAMARVALRNVHDIGSEVTTFAYRAGGGTALRPSLLQRAFRDMHAATQHLIMADQIIQECGRALLGLAGTNARWTTLKLVDG